MANRKLNSEMMKKKSKKEGEKRAEVKLFEASGYFFFLHAVRQKYIIYYTYVKNMQNATNISIKKI